jgi:hypothetical protein
MTQFLDILFRMLPLLSFIQQMQSSLLIHLNYIELFCSTQSLLRMENYVIFVFKVVRLLKHNFRTYFLQRLTKPQY